MFTEETVAQYLLLFLENAAVSKKQFWKYKEELMTKGKRYWILAFIFNFV
jgi:hypothetical protein